MAYTVKIRTLPGAPFRADFDCEECGRYELTVERDANGDPPETIECDCGETAKIVIGSPKLAVWTRKPVPINPPGSTRKEEWDPRALDTRPLAEGKMTKAEWRKWQSGITAERRHQKRVKSGRKQKRIQVDSAGVKSK